MNFKTTLYSKIICTLLFIALFLFPCNNLISQELIRTLGNINENSGGYVTVTQSPMIKALLERSIAINKSADEKLQGYRIQLYSGYKHDARERSSSVKNNFLNLFPNFDENRIYSNFDPPFIKVRIGDYRDENSALTDYKKIVKFFPDCYIIKTTINYPALE